MIQVTNISTFYSLILIAEPDESLEFSRAILHTLKRG